MDNTKYKYYNAWCIPIPLLLVFHNSYNLLHLFCNLNLISVTKHYISHGLFKFKRWEWLVHTLREVTFSKRVFEASCSWLSSFLSTVTVVFRSRIWLPNEATLVKRLWTSCGRFTSSGVAFNLSSTTCSPAWTPESCEHNHTTDYPVGQHDNLYLAFTWFKS